MKKGISLEPWCTTLGCKALSFTGHQRQLYLRSERQTPCSTGMRQEPTICFSFLTVSVSGWAAVRKRAALHFTWATTCTGATAPGPNASTTTCSARSLNSSAWTWKSGVSNEVVKAQKNYKLFNLHHGVLGFWGFRV